MNYRLGWGWPGKVGLGSRRRRQVATAWSLADFPMAFAPTARKIQVTIRRWISRRGANNEALIINWLAFNYYYSIIFSSGLHLGFDSDAELSIRTDSIWQRCNGLRNAASITTMRNRGPQGESKPWHEGPQRVATALARWRRSSQEED